MGEMNSGLKGNPVELAATQPSDDGCSSQVNDQDDDAQEEDEEDDEAYNERRRAAMRQSAHGRGLPGELGLGHQGDTAAAVDSCESDPDELGDHAQSLPIKDSTSAKHEVADMSPSPSTQSTERWAPRLVSSTESVADGNVQPAVTIEAQLIEYVTNTAYASPEYLVDGLSFAAAQPVAVLQKGRQWCWVQLNGRIGWVPVTHIQERTITRQVPQLPPTSQTRTAAEELAAAQTKATPTVPDLETLLQPEVKVSQPAASLTAPRRIITHRILPSAWYSDLQPNTLLDQTGHVHQPLGVDGGFQCPTIPADRLRAPSQMRGPAVVAHDQTWRCAIMGAIYAKV